MAAPADGRANAWSWPLAAAIAAAVTAAYANSLSGSFQFDDWRVIVDEPAVANFPAWWASMPAIRPLLKLSYALNNAAGFGVVGFHAVNLGIHVANSLMIFALLARLALREGIEQHRARAIALIGTVVFALHPVQTEAVTYISGRSTSFAAFFSLASLLAWIGGRDRGRGWLLKFSVALFAAALLVKETSAVVPLAILLWESYNLMPESRPAFRAPWAHVLVLVLALAVAASSSRYWHLLDTSLRARGIGVNLLTQADAVFYLLGQLVRIDRLNADPALGIVSAWSAIVAMKAAALLLLLALGVFLLKRHAALSFGILWSFLWLAPTNSFIPRLDVVNDRQLYLAILGPAWIAAWLLGSHLSLSRGTLMALTVILALSLGVATHHRNRVYADEIVFWEDVIRKAPANGRAFNNLGYAYALASRKDDAESAFRHALALDPGNVRAAVNLRLLLEGGLTKRSGSP
jgi:tetratricopeptide (TPR) repeat protein